MAVTRRDADFESRGTRCAAWLYRPAGDEAAPVVVMAHGFGGERHWRLPAFAERFAERGLAVLLFDYRCFGDSDGTPRNLITPRGHVRDWLAALDHARGLDDVDAERLGVWGNSFSGGHILAAAARDADPDAAVLVAPFSDGIASVVDALRARGLGYGVRAVGAGLRDVVRAATGRSPHYVPIAAEPDGFGVLTQPGVVDDFEAISGGDWDNRCPARIFLSLMAYRPVSGAAALDCPTLLVQADRDRIIPTRTVDRLVERLPAVERSRYPVRHFDVFAGEPFDEIVAENAAFLERHLLG